MNEHIYALYHYLNGEKIYFYVGRSGREANIRFNEHRRNVSDLKHKEDVYCYIRGNCQCEIFEQEILCECDPKEVDDYEDFYVVQLIMAGCNLQNMKHGDQKSDALFLAANHIKTNSVKIDTVKEFREYREGERARKLREKVLNEEVVTLVVDPGVLESRTKHKAKKDRSAMLKASREKDFQEWLFQQRAIFEEERKSPDNL